MPSPAIAVSYRKSVEHRMGFEPMNTGFADQRVNHFAIGAHRCQLSHQARHTLSVPLFSHGCKKVASQMLLFILPISRYFGTGRSFFERYQLCTSSPLPLPLARLAASSTVAGAATITGWPGRQFAGQETPF